MTNWSALHDDNRVMAVLPLWRGGKAGNITCFHLPEHLLKTHGRKVVALIHNDVAVVDAAAPSSG